MVEQVKHWLWQYQLYIYAAFSYVVLLAYNMGEAFFHPARALNSGPFDHTVLMWLFSTSPNTPWWGHTDWSNYPIGENIWNPIHVIGQTFYIPFWAAAKVIGPFAAYNILTGIGIISTALIGFTFVRWLLKKNSFFVPFISGYIIAFTPYILIKSMVHPSYAFGGIIVGLVWAILIYLQKPTLQKIVVIGILSGVTLYTDIYFILYMLVVLMSGTLALIVLRLRDKHFIKVRNLAKHFGLYVLIITIFLSPLIIIKFTSSQKINSTLVGGRSEKWEEATAYGARPWEYVLPSVYNPLTPKRVVNFDGRHLHGSAYRETNLYVGLSVLLLATVWLVQNLKKTKTKFVIEQRRTTLFIGILLVSSILLSMSPKLEIKGITLYFPSYFITSFTGYWRVLSRLALVVQVALGIFAALGLYSLVRDKRFPQDRFRKTAVFTIIFILIFTDFMVFKPFKRYVWTQANIPSVYTTVENESDINAIAEYPMIDPPRNFHFIYYATYQMYHRKPIVDAIVIEGNNNSDFRAAIMNVKSSWQTTKVLKSMGVGYFVVHDKANPGDIPGASLLSSGYDVAADNTAWLYKINSLETLGCVVVPEKGFDGPSAYDYKENVQYYMHGNAELKLDHIPNAKQDCNTSRHLSLEFYTFEKLQRTVEISQGDKIVWRGLSNGSEERQQVTFDVDPDKPVNIKAQNAPKDFSLVVSNMIAN